MRNSKAEGRVPYTTSELIESSDRRVVDLTPLGFPEIPVLGMNHTSAATEGSVFHRHRRCLEITLCVRGSAKFDCEGRVYTLMPGSVFVSRPQDAHRLRMNQKGARLYWMFLRLPESGGTILGLPRDESAHLLGCFRKMSRRFFPVGEDVRQAFVEMFAAYDAAGVKRNARSFQLRMAALRLLSSLFCGSNRIAGEGEDRVFTGIIDRMRRNPQEEYDEDWLVAQTKLSPNTVLTRFRKLTGLPPHAFLVKCPIHRAKELLSRGWTVTRVASELKFASSQHFATRFRQEVGQTPTAWQGVHKNAK